MIRISNFAERSLAFIAISALLFGSIPAFPKIAEAATGTVFEDGFENSPAFSNPAWTSDPQWGTTGSNAHSGSKKAKVEGSATDADVLETSIDTSGYEGLTLSFWYRFQGLEADDSVVVEWFDGTNWNNLESFSGETGTTTDDITAWTEWTETLPTGAEDNSAFALRFTSDMNAGDDQFFLDDVFIEGEEIVVSTTTPVEEYFNGFESDTVDWTDGGGTTTRTSDGTDVVPSQCGDYHAVIDGPVFTRWGGYADEFPTGGYTTEVDVYLDTDLAGGSSDDGFDFSSAINGTDGNHRRDFVFSLETSPTEAGTWLVNASNNAPGNPSGDIDSVEITETGWYTLQAYFHDNGSGVLEVTMNVIKRSDDSVIFTENRSDPSDIIGTTVGGNRYGWFTSHRFDLEELAIDNAALYLGEPEERTCASDVPPTEDIDTIVVRQSNLQGWIVEATGGGTTTFVEAAGAPLGDGNLKLVSDSQNTARAGVTMPTDVLLKDLSGLSYQTKQNAANVPAGDAAYRIRFDADGNASTTNDVATLIYEPYWQNNKSPDADPVVPGIWQEWDVDEGFFWASVPGGSAAFFAPNGVTNGAGGPPFFTLDEMSGFYPNAKVTSFGVGIGSYNPSYDIDVDEVVFGTENSTNIYKRTYDFEPEGKATVQICKYNEERDLLDGWTLILRGDEVESFEVPANTMAGINTSNALDDSQSYLAYASGTWLNDREPDNHVDTEYSTEDGWVTHMDGFTGYGENILELQIADNFIDWGDYNADHEYTAAFTPATDGPVNFRIFDGNGSTPEAGWYADNSGSLDVTIEEGYMGVTEKGCVTFEEVPYGEYEIDEVMQDGWTKVSGFGPVTVEEEEVSFTVVNTDEPAQCVDQLEGDWADTVVSFDQGQRKNGSDVLEARSNEEDALDEADWTSGGSTGFVSLGFGGSIVVSFDSFVPNVDGNDISIHEATNGTYPAETALIEVSQDGEDWHVVGTSTSGGVTYHDFDTTGLSWIKYVRVTDTTNAALHANDADGFDLDAVDATETVCAEPEEPQMCSVTVVSDDTNFVEEKENNAVLSWAHAAWTAVIDGAEWIWGTEYVEDPTVDTTQTFVKEFEWSGGIASATLDIATDNSYVVTLNGVEVASSTDENNFQLGTQDSFDLSSYVEVGENTLEIEVLNKGVPGSTPTGNPAGLKYNLTIVSDETGEDCMFAPEADLEITKPETEDQVLSGEYTFEAEYTDADDNADPVQWAIRAGTCTSGSGTVAGNVDSFNTPYMWNGASFSSTIDMDSWDEGEYCFVVNPTEDGGENFRETRWFTLEHPEPTQCLIVSDTSTLVVDNNDFAVETWDEHNNWTHDIADATWIWDSFYVEDPEASTTRTFKETFTVTELGSSTLEIAADNTYTVYINGDLVVERLNANNYQTPDEYDVTSFIDEGENELEIIVTNIGTDDSIPKSNPAGLLFRLEMEVDGGQCVSTTEPEDGDGDPEPTPTYEVFGFAWNDDNTNDVKDGDEGYLSSVAVEITNGTTTMATTTDAGGRYYFMVEPDTWTLSAALSDWEPTSPDTTNNDHVVIVTATSGPHDFGFEEDEDGGGGSGSDAVNNDDDNNDENTGPDGRVEGVSDTNDGKGGGIDIWEDLRNEIGNSNGPLGSVLGATAEAQELDATTTIEVGGDDATPTEDDEEKASAPWKDWLCDYLWLLPLLWIIASAIAYWRKESYEDAVPMFWTQIIFGIVGLIFLVGYFIWGVPCAWLPSAIVAIGAGLMTYYGKE